MSENAEWLFDASAIPIPAPHTLPSHLRLRPLHIKDYEKGYDTLLDNLVKGAVLTQDVFSATFISMRRTPNTYYIVVLVDFSSGTERIVASSTLLVEHKFLRGGCIAGHIEDVVVARTHQGQGLGRVLIHACTSLAKQVGCYKIILDCSAENVGFYEKCGYAEKGREMKLYLNQQ